MSIIKPDLSTPPSLFLTHGVDILELHADMDSRGQASEVETAAWDYQEQKVTNIEGEYPSGIESKRDPQNGGDDAGSEETIKGFLDTIVSVFNKPVKMKASYMTSQELKAISDSKMLKLALSPVKGSVKYQGSTLALPGSFISIRGVGNQLNGKHFVSAIQHDYSDGCWTTQATLGWDEKFFTENIHPHHPSSSTGQVSTIQGLHIGIVTDLEDPSGQYRVKVRLPLVNENEEGVYARIATLDAGNNRGTFFRPEIDDEVLVGFMNDDPRHPVILGMLHSSKKPAPIEPKNVNNEKGYVSRSGVRMIYNDEKKSVLIETPGSRSIEMDDDAGSITIKDSNGNRIVMDSSGITIESSKDLVLKAAKSISVSAPEISLKADASMSVEGGGTTSVKSSGVTEVKGSIVKIN
jgi:phage baseplate assembly protein gpV